MQGNSGIAPTLMALSVVTDVTRDRPPGSAVRTGLYGLLLAEAMGLDGAGRRGVFYASLLRFLGCSSYAHELS